VILYWNHAEEKDGGRGSGGGGGGVGVGGVGGGVVFVGGGAGGEAGRMPRGSNKGKWVCGTLVRGTLLKRRRSWG